MKSSIDHLGLLLICDRGGGTSDFSLVCTHVPGGNVQFERTAIGDHLLLGGAVTNQNCWVIASCEGPCRSAGLTISA